MEPQIAFLKLAPVYHSHWNQIVISQNLPIVNGGYDERMMWHNGVGYFFFVIGVNVVYVIGPNVNSLFN